MTIPVTVSVTALPGARKARKCLALSQPLSGLCVIMASEQAHLTIEKTGLAGLCKLPKSQEKGMAALGFNL